MTSRRRGRGRLWSVCRYKTSPAAKSSLNSTCKCSENRNAWVADLFSQELLTVALLLLLLSTLVCWFLLFQNHSQMLTRVARYVYALACLSVVYRLYTTSVVTLHRSCKARLVFRRSFVVLVCWVCFRRDFCVWVTESVIRCSGLCKVCVRYFSSLALKNGFSKINCIVMAFAHTCL